MDLIQFIGIHPEEINSKYKHDNEYHRETLKTGIIRHEYYDGVLE